jgi:hypothetical protein
VFHEKIPPGIERNAIHARVFEKTLTTPAIRLAAENHRASEVPAWAKLSESVKLIEVHFTIRGNYGTDGLRICPRHGSFEGQEFAVDLVPQSALIC